MVFVPHLAFMMLRTSVSEGSSQLLKWEISDRGWVRWWAECCMCTHTRVFSRSGSSPLRGQKSQVRAVEALCTTAATLSLLENRSASLKDCRQKVTEPAREMTERDVSYLGSSSTVGWCRQTVIAQLLREVSCSMMTRRRVKEEVLSCTSR